MGKGFETRQEYIDYKHVMLGGWLIANKTMYESMQLVWPEHYSKPWNDLVIGQTPFGTESEESFQEWKAWAAENRRMMGCKHPDVYKEFAKEATDCE